MTIHVLYHRKTKPTGEVLGRVLNAEHGEYLTRRSTRDVLIRWGSRAPGFWGTDLTLNGVSGIENASDKFKSLQLMKDAGVSVPNFSTDPDELSLPFLGRRTSHSKGRDVVLCLQKGDYKRNARDYYVEYVPTTREFRVHVVDGKVIRVQGKFASDMKKSREIPWLRNHSSGYVFKKPRMKLRAERTNMAVEAVAALGLDFGAVDLLIGDDGQTYVLEVNTAPACSPITMKAYAEAFMKKLGLERNDVRFSALTALSFEEDDSETDDEEEENTATQAVREREPAPAETQSVTAERPGNPQHGITPAGYWRCECTNMNRDYTHTCTRCGRTKETS